MDRIGLCQLSRTHRSHPASGFGIDGDHIERAEAGRSEHRCLSVPKVFYLLRDSSSLKFRQIKVQIERTNHIE